MSLEEIIFCNHLNEEVIDLGRVIKAIESLGRIQVECKEAAGRGMRSVDIVGWIDEEKFMIGQLMVKKERSLGYIVQEVSRWRDLSGDGCAEVTNQYAPRTCSASMGLFL
jgi:hypothetical protein